MANHLLQLYTFDNSRLKRWLLIELLFAAFIFTVWCIKDVFFHGALGASDFIITCIIVCFPFVMMFITVILLYFTKSSDGALSSVQVIALPEDTERLMVNERRTQCSRHMNSAQQFGSSCAICLEKNCLLPLHGCGHCFHEVCIERWFLENPEMNCPTCRTSHKNQENFSSHDYFV